MTNALTISRGFKALLLTGAAGTIALATPAFAQDAAPSDSTDATASTGSDAIVVTGSRIARKDYDSNSPIVTVGDQLLQNSSTASVEVNLNKLPQFTPEKTPTCLTCGGDIQGTPTNTPGSATVSLRGLGSNRNLVLIDGRRATPANASMAVDINTIPSAAIERVEVITGGASSTYGADAVGGVVNFILKKNFQGLELDGQYSVTEHGDGQEYNVNGIMGTNFADGRGNISIAMSYDKRDPSYRINRSWFRDQFANPNVTGDYFFPTFSGITQTGAGAAYQTLLNSMFPHATGNVSATGSLYFLPDGTPFTIAVNPGSSDPLAGISNFPSSMIDQLVTKKDVNGGISQNFPVDYLTLPMTRYNFYMRGNYEINDWISVIAQGYFNQSKTHTVQQPGPIVGGWNVVIPRYNSGAPGAPNDATWLPANLVALLNARTNPNAPWSPTGYIPGLGNRTVDTDVYTYNMVAGFEGSVPGTDWTWDATVSRGVSNTNFVTDGVASLERLRAVMSAPNFGAGMKFSGNAAGGGFGASSATCTSGLNPFSNAPVSQDCIDAISAPLKETATMQQMIWEANAQGKVIDVPAGEVRLALGATYRDNKYTFLEDNLKTSGSSFLDQALGIYPAKNIDSDLSSKEVYGEMNIPLIHDTPGIKLLEVNGGIRYADSSQTGGSTTWKIEGSWEVTDWLRFRASYNKAQRAPNVGELFSFTQNFGLLTGGDACSTGNPYSYSANPANAHGADVLALCKALMDKTHIPGQPLNSVLFYGNGLSPSDPAYIPPSVGSQSTSTFPGFAFPYFVGNPDLKPEDAKTLTVGGVISSPSSDPWLSGMRLSVDYYNIRVDNAIGLQSGQTLQQLCLDSAFNPTFDPNTFFCNNFQRGTGGGIGAVQLAYTNTAAFRTSGIDVQFDWNVAVGKGKVSLNEVFSYLISLKSSPFYSGVPTASQTPFFEYAGTTLAPDAGLSTFGAYRWKSFTTLSYSLGGLQAGIQWQHLPAIATGTTNTGYGSYDLFSLNASYAVTDNVSLRAGVDNLFNRAPPFGGVNPNPVYPGLAGGGLNVNNYDAIGRRFYFGVNTKF